MMALFKPLKVYCIGISLSLHFHELLCNNALSSSCEYLFEEAG